MYDQELRKCFTMFNQFAPHLIMNITCLFDKVNTICDDV